MIFLGLAENSIQLVPDGTLFLHIAIILLMVYALNATLFKPINRILENREQQTHGRLGQARGMLKEVDEKLSHYEHRLREARANGYRLLEGERNEAMRKKQEKLSIAREEIKSFIGEEKREIAAQADKARLTLEQDARHMATEISAHILRRPAGDTSGAGTRI